MLKLIAFGEALIDFLAAPADPAAPDAPRRFVQQAGGAPANVAVAVARLGGDSAFAGMFAHDLFGDFLVEALAREGVGTECVRRTARGKTALAFVALDAHGERSFAFYRDASADLLFRAEDFDPAWFGQPGIFHFCSNTLTEPAIAVATRAGAELARTAGHLVSFDVNLRPALWPTGADPRAPVLEALADADLVKLSREEFDWLRAGADEDATLAAWLAAGPRLVLITDGGRPLRYVSRAAEGWLTPPEVRAVDTTAAGDAFVGGLLFGLARLDIGAAGLDALLAERGRLERLLGFALACGASAVTRHGAFDSLPRLSDLAVPAPD